MKTREDIVAWLLGCLDEMFDIPKEDVRMDSELGDLDLDSIDAVDLVVRFREITGKRIEPDVFKSVRTVDDLVDALHNLISE